MQFRRMPVKRIICAVLILTMLFPITACSNNRKQQSQDIKSEVSANTSDALDSKDSVTDKSVSQTESSRVSTDKEITEMKMKIQVGDSTFTATLAENSSVDALKKLMADSPLTLNMRDYANMEKGADLGVKLPQNNQQMNTQPGDIILYQGRMLVIYYDTNSWNLTPIGKIDNVDKEGLKTALGDGDVTVTLSLE